MFFSGLSKKFSVRDARYLTKISTGTNFFKSVLGKNMLTLNRSSGIVKVIPVKVSFANQCFQFLNYSILNTILHPT